MVARIIYWLLAGLSLLVLSHADTQAQQGVWERHNSAFEAAYQQGDYDEAATQIKAALEAAKAFGPDDPRLATTLNNLALVYDEQGRYAEAKSLYERALAIWETALGPEHPHVATGRANYAAFLRETGQTDEADNLEARAKAKPQGAQRTYSEAVEWYRKAAIRGDVNAQYVIGFHYAKGEGVPRNYVQAYLWWSLSATQGHKKAAKHRDTVARQMTPAQIAEAEQLAQNWIANQEGENKPRQVARPNTPIESAELVPQFALPAVDANIAGGFATDDLRGRVTVVNVFASWCRPCLVEHPLLSRLAADGFPLYGINHRDTAPKAVAWLKKNGNPFTAVGFDPDGRVGAKWGVTGLPETYIIDVSGRIIYKHDGPITPQILEDKILPMLREAQTQPW